MTVVTTVIDLTADDARRLTDQIKVAVEATWQLVIEAYTRRAWTALGYPSWDDYCTREFGTSRLKLPREDRQEVVSSLRDAGLSTRAIAAATGVHRETVMKDLQVVGNRPPDPEPAADPFDNNTVVTPPSFLDEMTDDDWDTTVEANRPTDEDRRELEDAVTAAQAQAATDRAAVEQTVAQRVTGIDGKSYKATAPAQDSPRRSPLPDAALRAGVDLRKLIERVERIFADDRFTANKEQVAAHLDGHLSHAVEVFQDLLARFDHQQMESN